MHSARAVLSFAALGLLCLTAACSNGRGTVEAEDAAAGEAPQNDYAVGGSVSGLTGSGLVLRNNGGDDLTIGANGEFIFPARLANGASYQVTVAAQPTNPTQTCSVSGGSGVIGSADVTSVLVSCASGQWSVGGAVSGLLGSGLILQVNGGGDLLISSNGAFEFAERFGGGAIYNVTVRSQPTAPAQNCAVSNASGTIGNNNVTNVSVVCASNVFTIGGTVIGLAGTGLVLRLNGGNDLPINANGGFAFATTLADGAAYEVTVGRQPSDPTQVCTVTNGAGIVNGANVVNAAVTCTTPSYRVGGSVSGLTGSGLVLQLNGASDLVIASNGRFNFDTLLPSGSTYRVTVRTQPSDPAQVCTLAGAEGTVGAGDVATVRVTCSSSTFSVGGSVAGLLGAGLQLANNGGDVIEIDFNGAFTFSRELASGAAYNVTVRRQPSDPAQACSVSNGSGVIGSSDVTNVVVRCETSDFTIGGTVRGLEGSELVLSNNADEEITINSNGDFTFPTAIPDGAAYNVAVAVQPHDPDQTCSVRNGSGVVSGSNVTNVRIDCEAVDDAENDGFRISGHVSELVGAGLVLQNNGADDLAIASNGSFSFSQRLPSGASYNVTVAVQPSNPSQTCVVLSGSGTVGDSDIQNVDVNCNDIRD